MTEISEQELNAAKEWLASNTDKWENWCGFRFLVPIEEIPPVVIKYAEFEKENEEFLRRQDELIDRFENI